MWIVSLQEERRRSIIPAPHSLQLVQVHKRHRSRLSHRLRIHPRTRLATRPDFVEPAQPQLHDQLIHREPQIAIAHRCAAYQPPLMKLRPPHHTDKTRCVDISLSYAITPEN